MIKANKQSKDYYIDIECYFVIPKYIKNSKAIYAGTATKAFENMINKITVQLESNNFKIVDAHWSNKSSDSYYLSFYVRDANGAVQNEALIHLRISGHYTKNKNDKDYLKNGSKYYSELDEKYKIDNTIPDTIFKSIIIGNSEFKDEQAVINYITAIIQELKVPEADLEDIMQNFSFKNGVQQ